MSAALTPQVVHAIPGRARLHLPDWTGASQREVETRLRRIAGVRSVKANPATGNVLIRFDPDRVTTAELVRDVASPGPRQRVVDGHEYGARPHPAPLPVHESKPSVVRQGHGRARIAVRGLERDPQVARQVVAKLRSHPGVRRVTVSTLTGRVLAEFDDEIVGLDDLLADVTGLELPSASGEDRPDHPLDQRPLLQSAARLIGSLAGIGVLVGRQLGGAQGPPVAGAVTVAASVGIVESFPFARKTIMSLLGRNGADLLFTGANITTLTLAGSPLGLAMTAASSLRLFTEIRARRAAYLRYEEQMDRDAPAEPGATIRVEAGDRVPEIARIVEGAGTAIGWDGLPSPVRPGEVVPPGTRLYGGPFQAALEARPSYEHAPRVVPIKESAFERYAKVVGWASLGYAALTALLTRSYSRVLAALVLVNPRTAAIGKDAADLGAAARVIRAGVTVVGTRPERVVQLPGALILDSPRLLTDGLEITGILPLSEEDDTVELLSLASGVAAAAGSPWGAVFRASGRMDAEEGRFDGITAVATVAGVPYSLGPIPTLRAIPGVDRPRRGEFILALRHQGEARSLGILSLRPKLAAGVDKLVSTAAASGVALGVLSGGNPDAAEAIARRAHIPLLPETDAVAAVRARQASGGLVAYASDSARSAPAFAACDLAIAVSSGRAQFPAAVDLVAPDLGALVSILDAADRRRRAVRDSMLLSVASNVAGSAWGLGGNPQLREASITTYVTAMEALADAWARERGGKRGRAVTEWLADPRPERWGQRGLETIFAELHSSASGLTSDEAAHRHQESKPVATRSTFVHALVDQVNSPLTGILAAGAAISFALGSVADVALIGAMIVANAVAGAWQEHTAGQAAKALEDLSAPVARVIRDGAQETIAASALVPGDVLILAPGDRVPADARLFIADGLEVDEAALTGESLPVAKSAHSGTAASRIVLEGCDVVVGTGRAVVVAVGRDTRMGATAAALKTEEATSPLGARLSAMLRQVLPLAALGGVIVTVAGTLRGRPLLSQLAIGSSIAVAAVPEGLPLLAAVGEGAVARRLAGQHALVRRLAAVEALGRVNVVCCDKTGTLTEGRLALSMVADPVGQGEAPSAAMPDALRDVLLTAALASPHPDAPDAAAHPTDIAVVYGADKAGLHDRLRVPRDGESSFDPVRAFHASRVGGRVCVKGAPEALIPRCSQVRRGGADVLLDDAGRAALLDAAHRLAEQGLRVLAAAEAPGDRATNDPRHLTALGFVGISDPLRAGVLTAVRRCQEAGIRVIMLTGDHPATAQAIAHQAGLLDAGHEILTAAEIAGLDNGELEQRLERTGVIARITPMDKVRIVESFQRAGYTVAMTGDGVNDSPALRLADVGVAMGKGGTEVARQAADVVLADDDFSTLGEALVEGRGFWRNTRRAIGLLLGGNLGELGLVVAANAVGLLSPLTARQILAVNLVTDVLPALTVMLQRPEHNNLSALAREGTAGLGRSLWHDILRRGAATAVPALAAYALLLGSGGVPAARTVAFASIVVTQLAQTLDAGRTSGGLSASVGGAVAASLAMLFACLLLPPLSMFLGLASPGAPGWLLIGASAVAAVVLSRGLRLPTVARPALRMAPAPAM